MLRRIVNFIPISVYQDGPVKINYLKTLTTDKIESFKIPAANLNDYKYSHYLNPNWLLEAEVVKTKKNWILTHISKAKELCQLVTYNDFVKFAELSDYLHKNLWEGQDSNLQAFLINNLTNTSFSTFETAAFCLKLDKMLGIA